MGPLDLVLDRNEEIRVARILQICTVPESLLLLEGLIKHLKDLNHEVTVITSPSATLDYWEGRLGLRVVQVPMSRAISPFADLVSLVRLTIEMRRLKPDVVHCHTPKAGLLGMIGAKLTGCRRRIYHLRGLRAATLEGVQRHLLLLSEMVATGLGTTTVVVSPSLEKEARELGCLRAAHVVVTRSGQGVDAHRFFSSPERHNGREFRRTFGIPQEVPVIGFVGRMSRDKGVRELRDAWAMVKSHSSNPWLLILGNREENEGNDVATFDRDERVLLAGFQGDPRPAYEAMSMLIHPSYREGFPNVLLEAAAMSLPVITTTATGCVDAVLPGHTGSLVPARDVPSLAQAIMAYLDDPDLGRAQGFAGRNWVVEQFQPQPIWRSISDLYDTRQASGVRED